MKIAVIADIHANYPALEAVLQDIKERKIKQVWNLGDIIGYGPYPNEVIRALKNNHVRSILGNNDTDILNFPRNKERWKGKKSPVKYFSFAWTYRSLKSSSMDYLSKLPMSLRLNIAGKKFFLFHGSPRALDDPLSASTPISKFREIAQKIREGIILCGHTHVFFKKRIAGVTFINPGSVGRPFDHNPNASYVILDISDGRMHVKNCRIKYNQQKTLSKLKREGFPKEIIRTFAEGKSLDRVLHEKWASQDEGWRIDQVVKFAQSYKYEKGHSHQVARLALHLFDELKDLHRLTGKERLLLHAAGILHDIGWIKGREGHHKRALEIIVKAQVLPFNKEDRMLVGLVSRYHRRALPEDTHKYYASLAPQNKNVVRKLASFLRMADGLDRRHTNNVRRIRCRITPSKIFIKSEAKEHNDLEITVALEKSDLFKSVFKKEVDIRWA